MYRSKKIVLVSHCILNQNSVVHPCGRNMSNFKKLLTKIIGNNIGIIQLPCPEISLYGVKRWGHVKDQFNTPHFKKQSKKLIENIIDNVIDYKNNGYEILGVIGIKGSPSCGVTVTCLGNWYGEVGGWDMKNKLETLEEGKEPGVFMEILKESLIETGTDVEFYDNFERFIETL